MAGKPEAEEAGPELFFLLASVDRKRIISEIQKESLHMNELAKRLGMTSTEALRQLQRMTVASLLEKRPDGRYILTPYAEIVLDAAASLDFITRYKDFFMRHDAKSLPVEFRARLAELSNTELIPQTIEGVNLAAQMFRGAKDRMDCTLEQGSKLHLEIVKQRIADGVKFRWLMQESFLPKARDLLQSVKKFPEMRVTPRLCEHVYIIENEAGVSLRLNTGPFDYTAFHGRDPQFLKWANDLFAHDWERAKPWYP